MKNFVDHILSYDESICYYDDVSTFKCPLVIHNVKNYEDTTKAKYKYDCPSKFYKEASTGDKVCLSENEECPATYALNPDTNECVTSCDTGYCEVEKLCLKLTGTCPSYWKK